MGILMLLDPFIGIILFLEGISGDIFVIFLYLSIFAALFVIIGGILVKNDYTHLGIDYLKLGINTLRISLVFGIIGIIVFNLLVTIPGLGDPFDLLILYIVLYNIVEVASILILIFILVKLSKIIKTHDHGEKFKHHT